MNLHILLFAPSLILFCGYANSAKKFNSRRIRTAGDGLAQVIDAFSEKFSIRFNLVIAENRPELLAIVRRVMRVSKSSLTIQTQPFHTNNKTSYGFGDYESQIFLFYENFTLSETAAIPRTSLIYKNFIVIDFYFARDFERNLTIPGSESAASYAYQIFHHSDKELLLSGKNIKNIIGDKSCKPQQSVVSIYSLKSKSWNVELKQLSNFYNQFKKFKCALDVLIFEDISSVSDCEAKINVHQNASGSFYELQGILSDILKEFSSKNQLILRPHMDFKIDYELQFYVDLPTGSLWNDDFFQLLPMSFVKLSYYVTRGAQYNYYEKMILPFDIATWMWIIISFVAGYMTIFVIYLCPKFVQQFVFGTYIRDPSLNLAEIFFGVGLVKTPGRNFARFLFMMFTLFCLIIRTAYQGKMFEFLNADMRRSTAKTIQDLYDMKIPIIMNEVEMDMSVGHQKYTVEDELFLLERQRLYGNESFAIPTRLSYGLTTKHFHANFKENPEQIRNSSKFMKHLEESYKWLLFCVPIKRNSFLYEPLQKFILEYYQHGLMAYSESKWNPQPLGADEPDEPKVLTVQMMSAGFVIWLVCVLMSLIVFLIELTLDCVRYYLN